MNTLSIGAASRIICEAMAKNRVPATIAVALDANGLLHTVETAAELVRLRLLQNAMPAELSEAQTDALADAGNRALNDHHHEDLCLCSDWPESCVSSGNYFAGRWDTAAFSIGMAAVIGAWESMRAPAEADEIARLRSDRVGDAAQFEEYRTLVATLRARVAELEAEHSSLVAARDAQIIAWLGKKAREYGESNRESRAKSEAVWRMADKLSRGAVRQPLGAPADTEDEYRYCGADLGRTEFPFTCHRRVAHKGPHGERPDPAPVEDPHDSPLHHDYRLGHDLPEARRG